MVPSRRLAGRPEPLSLDDSEESLRARWGREALDAAALTAAHEIRPRLFLGSVFAALDPDELHARRITHVLCAIGSKHVVFDAELPPPAQRQQTGTAPPARIIYLALDLADRPEQDIVSHLDRACDWLRAALEEESSCVLVHCVAGVSRSASLVVAFLMLTEGLTAARALEEVVAVRCCCNPNRGFRAQLVEFERTLEAQRRQAGLPPLLRIDAERGRIVCAVS